MHLTTVACPRCLVGGVDGFGVQRRPGPADGAGFGGQGAGGERLVEGCGLLFAAAAFGVEEVFGFGEGGVELVEVLGVGGGEDTQEDG